MIENSGKRIVMISSRRSRFMLVRRPQIDKFEPKHQMHKVALKRITIRLTLSN